MKENTIILKHIYTHTYTHIYIYIYICIYIYIYMRRTYIHIYMLWMMHSKRETECMKCTFIKIHIYNTM